MAQTNPNQSLAKIVDHRNITNSNNGPNQSLAKIIDHRNITYSKTQSQLKCWQDLYTAVFV